jgi:hemerythrin-like domain-containing protein
MLKVLEREAARMEAGERVNTETLEQGIDFLRNFADQCHHTKEEKELFPAMAKAGVPVDGGPIGVMLHDHVEGRGHIRAMSEALDAYRQGDETAAKRLAGSIRAYTELLTAHIWKEDNILFTMADQVLSDSVQQELVARFDRIESEHMGEGVHERYHQMLDDLEAGKAA